MFTSTPTPKTRCRAKDPSTCVYHGAYQRMYAALERGSVADFLDERERIDDMEAGYDKRSMAQREKRQEHTDPLILPVKLDAAFEVLQTLGMSEEDKHHFETSVQNPRNYAGGSFEWTERGHGLRIIVHKPRWSNKITDIQAIKHGYSARTDEEFEQANQKLRKALVATGLSRRTTSGFPKPEPDELPSVLYRER